MPIYAYRCAGCGHTKDLLRKLSDPPLADCPACGTPRFEKQVTAAGFQLKGSGWYVTDFRNPQAAPTAAKADADKPAADTADKADKAANAGDGGTPALPTAPAPAATAAAATPTPAAASKPAVAPGPAGNAG